MAEHRAVTDDVDGRITTRTCSCGESFITTNEALGVVWADHVNRTTIATSGQLMDPEAFMDLGFLQEVNRLVLHPAGLALALAQNADDGSWSFYGVFDWREDPEGCFFGPGEVSADKRKSVRAEWDRHGPTRIAALQGNFLREGEGIIQPIGVYPDEQPDGREAPDA